MPYDEKPYEIKGNRDSDQAESSTANRGASTMQMRVLIELQVISYLLSEDLELGEVDLPQLRQDIADSIT